MGRFFRICFSLLLTTLLPALELSAQSFDFNERCQSAYQNILRLKVKDAKHFLALEKEEYPNNLVPYFLENYISCFSVLFNGNQSDYEHYMSQNSRNMAQVKKGPSDSPYYLFMQASLNLQTAACKYKFDEKFSAFWHVRRAYLQIIKNQEKYPHFAPNKIFLGPMQALVGSIPPNYRWATRLLGFKNGSVNEGLRTLHSFLDSKQTEGAFFKKEALIYYVYMVFYLRHDPRQAISVLENHHPDLKENALYAFMAANLYLNDHASDKATKIIKQHLQSTASSEYLDMPIMHYELATAYLNHLELDKAIREYKIFLDRYKGLLYTKDALYRLSWIYYLKGDRATASKYRKLVLSEGNTVTDADDAALRKVKAGEWPDQAILEARLSFDGGYFEEALKKLLSRSIQDYRKSENQIKYFYFLARINDEMGEDDQAILLYEMTINKGKNAPEYYAARSALQMGFIYEKRKNNKKAISYFQQCLDMPNKEYKKSLDQRAKSGINRLTTQ